MRLDLELSDEDVDRIARRVVELLGRPSDPWVNVQGAAEYLGVGEGAIRGMVKRRQIPFHKMETGRIRFSRSELDDWMHGGVGLAGPGAGVRS